MALASDSLELEEIADPGAPAADKVRIFAQDENGVTSLKMREAAGDAFDIRRDQLFIVRNVSGSTIAKGTPVYINGQSGGVPTVLGAECGPYGTPSGNIAQAIAAESIANNAYGRVLSFGLLSGIDTSSFTAGALLYLGTSGGFQTTVPGHPYIVQRLARVLTVHATTGSIFVHIHGGARFPYGSGDRITQFGDPSVDPNVGGPTVVVWVNANGELGMRSGHTANRTLYLPDADGTIARLEDLAGAGSPGGNTGEVQYKNGTAFAGASKLTVDAGGYPILGEATSTTPATPSAGSTLFSRFRAGRRMAGQVGPSGVNYTFQPFLGGNKVGVLVPNGNGTTITALGIGNSTTGTATTRNVATTNFATSLRRLAYVSAATAGSSAGTRNNAAQFYRGNAAGRGGFLFVARFTLDTVQSGMRWFVGMVNATAVIGNVNPSTLTNMFGFGIDASQTTVRFFYNDGAGTASSVDLGVNFPATTVDVVYEIRLFSAPNGSDIFYSIERLDSAQFSEGSVNTDIPANTTLLSPQVWINNGATAAAVGIGIVNLYIETDN